MAARRVVDAVAPAARRATLEAHELADEPRVIEQRAAHRVEHRQDLNVNIGFWFRRRRDGDRALAKRLAHPVAPHLSASALLTR